MLVQNQIFTSVLNGKYYSGILSNKIYEQKMNGEDPIENTQKEIILIKWIEILEDYLSNNFDLNGNHIPPVFFCLTYDEISDIMAKMAVMIGDNIPPPGDDWLLATARWNDAGYWRDSATWNDTLPII